MAVLKSYNYGLIYRRLTSKYFNMHDYSLLEAMNLWDWKDAEFEKQVEANNNGQLVPERDIVFLRYDTERRAIELPNTRVLYVVEDTGGLWIYTSRWILLNPSIEGIKTITPAMIDRIVGIGGIDENEGNDFDNNTNNPKFYSDIQFVTDYQRKHLLSPKTEVLYVVKDVGEFWMYGFDGQWYQVSPDPSADIEIRAISTQAIDIIVKSVEIGNIL